jgi:hypothetical protein
MDKDTRNAIERATQKARRLLQDDLAAQLEGHFDVLLSGAVAAKAGKHLSARERLQREKIVAAVEHKRAAGMKPDEAVADYIRDAAFTTLNRFVALKMLEARDLVQECITRGEQSGGYKEFCGMAPGLALLPDAAGYRLYVESLFDELSVEIKVLFDRRDVASVLWPRRQTFDDLLAILNAQELSGVWAEDETIGWVYQYFNSGDERRAMRDASQAPRNSRELAVRNQFFTPRYVVQFLTDNTLGRTWYEMRKGDTVLRDRCEYLVRRPSEVFLAEGAKVPPEEPTEGLSQEELLRRTVHVSHRPKKDPRDLKILDPACGSGHFLLYAFDLLLAIYDEAWADPDQPPSEATGRTLAADYPDRQALLSEAPILVLQHNLHGVDIDPRCTQISQLALWMRAQRAFRDLSLPRADRPRIRRSNVVLAEPMPGEDDLLRDFTSNLGDPMLAELFVKLVDSMKLAGELGLLLRLGADRAHARQGAVGTPRSPGGAHPLDPAAVPECYRDRPTHAAPAVHRRCRSRLALLELTGKRFDVVLMNPPFGACGAGAKKEFENAYPRTKNDLYAAFVERGIELLHGEGLLGAITSRTGFFLSSFQRWREDILESAPPVAFADLGLGVMDAALVESAAYCLEKAPTVGKISSGHELPEGDIAFLRVLEEADDKQSALLGALRDPDAVRGRQYFEINPKRFADLPRSPFAYWAGESLRALFRTMRPLAGEDRTACVGDHPGDGVRFIRLWTEVSTGGARRWVPYQKGGVWSPFYCDIHLVADWDSRRSTYRGFLGRPGRLNERPSNFELFFRPGLTWPRRTKSELSLRAMPAGCIFADKGPAVIVRADDVEELLALLAVTNTQVFRALVDLQLAAAEPTGRGGVARSYEVGVLQCTPVPAYGGTHRDRLASLARQAWVRKRTLDIINETSHAFVVPRPLWSRRGAFDPAAIEVELADLRRQIDDFACNLYGITGKDHAQIDGWSRNPSPASAIKDTPEESDEDETSEDSTGNDEDIMGLISWSVGVAFGRFDIRLATGERAAPPEPEPFDPLPARSPGMLPEGDPPFRQGTGIQVDDPGHHDDLTAVVTSVLNAVNVEPPADLRRTLARDFFPFHIQRYSKSRRKAPIYWQIAAPSASYSVWLYLHGFSADTMYKVQNDYVGPKLRHEEQKLDRLRREYGDSPTASQRKELDSQETFVAELRTFLDEVKRVAPLWKPDLDDGVIINFAPLWRLVPHHRPWQKECKTTWDALADGDYDWSHLSMHLWPERVVPKCQQDRSWPSPTASKKSSGPKTATANGNPAQLPRDRSTISSKSAPRPP